MLTPFYEEDGITIYCGDCLEVMAELGAQSFDAVIGDPPFSSGARTDASKGARGTMLRGVRWESDWFSHDNLATVGFVFLMRLVCLYSLKAVKLGGTIQFFIDWRMYPNLYGAMESCGWVVKNLVVWDKQHFGMGSNYRNQHELIIYAEKPGGDGDTFKTHSLGNVLRARRVKSENHPTEKPLDLLRTLLTAVTKPGEIVLDPFCGSGTTLVAAQQEGRRAVGIDISLDYCKIAVDRLRQRSLWQVVTPESPDQSLALAQMELVDV